MQKTKGYEIRASYTDEVSELEKKNRILAKEIAAEGIVLLENDGVLPLHADDIKIALYGNGARRTIYGGTGSGEVNSREQVNIEDGLIGQGAVITTQLWLDRYEKAWIKGKERYIREGRAKLKKFSTEVLAELIASEYQYPYGDEITGDDLKNSNTDACVYVVSRQSGEGRDRTVAEGDYKLADVELENIRKCASFYKKCIVVINTGASMDICGLDGIEGINAVLYMSLLGMESGNAFADILYGKQTPSGHLAATWAYRYEDTPGAMDFGEMAKDGSKISYTEGILVGYRYFDTNRIQVRYPFGYGLSYTAFESRVAGYEVSGSVIKVCVKVKNVGSVYAGKYVVGIYAGRKENPDNEKAVPSKSLIGFEKTKTLRPEEEVVMSLEIPIDRLGTYDENTNMTKICQGAYALYLGIDINTSEFAGEFTIDSEQILCDHNSSDNSGKSRGEGACLTKKNTACLEKVENIVKGLSEKELIELCVGNGLFSDGKGYQVPGSVGCTSTRFVDKGIRNILMCDGPAGVRIQRRSTINKKGKIKPVDFPLSFFELLPDFITKLRVGNPDKDKVIYQFVTGFPVATAAAQTWNRRLCFDMGCAVGREMEKYGVTLWLAPAVNIIRNPLCGRNYEYYSEDPVLAGELAACVIKGVQKMPGCGVTVKHFACNNQETNRYYMSSELSERTLRDIYLKPFEIIVKEAEPKALMTAYNKVNGVYAAENEHLLKDILRNEWGYKGLVMTDWLSVGEDRADEAKSIHAGIDLIMPGNRKNKRKLYKEYKAGLVSRADLQRAAKNVLSAIMEGR